MSEEEMEILEELSKQNYFGDLPFLFYADLIAKLIANYNKEKEKNKLLIEGKFREVADKNSYIKDNYISKDKIKQCIEKLEIEKKFYFEKQVIQGRIDLLQELLEERN